MRQKKDVVLAYFAMMLVEKHRTCRSIFVDVVALYRAGLRGYNATVCCYYLPLLLCGGTALPHYAAIISYVTAGISRSFLVGVRGYDDTLFLHYLIDCKYFVINS